MTEAERLWQMLRLGKPKGTDFADRPIGRFIADLVCHAARLIVEIDGGQHDCSSERELRRARFLEGEGYRVLRFWDNEVLDDSKGVLSVLDEGLQ